MSVIEDVLLERGRQDVKWGQQNHPDIAQHEAGSSYARCAYAGIFEERQAKAHCRDEHDFGRPNWTVILIEEVSEAISSIGDDDELEKELIQVAAVAVQWVECIRRRSGAAKMQVILPLTPQNAEELEDEELEAVLLASPPYWRCDECGHEDRNKPMPPDRAVFYARISMGARRTPQCPRCGSYSFLPVGH